MDFLAQPPHAAAGKPEATLAACDSANGGDGDRASWDGSDGGSLTDESEDEQAPGAGRGGRSKRSFVAGKAGTGADPSPAGEAVAVAALATDYGAWLKRLAVRLRRSTPAGECFVRLRCIGPAVTGEQARG